MTAVEVYQSGGIGESIVVFGNLAAQIAKTEFVPDTFRNKPEAVLACMLFGQELGLGPMASLNLVQSIKGKVGLKPEGMRAVVQAHGHRIWTEEYTTEAVTLCGQRKGQETVERVRFTMEDAAAADLLGNATWKKYPRPMLLARATSELCRLTFSDVTGGIAYGPDELEEMTAHVEVVGASGRSGANSQAFSHTTSPRQLVAAIAPPASVDPETGEVAPAIQAPRKRKPPTGIGGVGTASPTPQFVSANEAQVKDIVYVKTELAAAGDEWVEKAKAAWTAAGVPEKAAAHLSEDEASTAYMALQQVFETALAAGAIAAPTLDGE